MRRDVRDGIVKGVDGTNGVNILEKFRIEVGVRCFDTEGLLSDGGVKTKLDWWESLRLALGDQTVGKQREEGVHAGVGFRGCPHDTGAQRGDSEPRQGEEGFHTGG